MNVINVQNWVTGDLALCLQSDPPRREAKSLPKVSFAAVAELALVTPSTRVLSIPIKLLVLVV